MTSLIHPTAVISDKATLGSNVSVGPYSVIGDDVTIGDNVEIKSHVVLAGHTEIGENTRIFPFASIGEEPQDLKYSGEKSKLVIGKNNVIREHVTMHPGTEAGDMITVVGDNSLFMIGVHIAHDCHLGNNVIMANNATLGGHVHVGNNAIIGGLAAVHQFVRIGAYAMVGGMSGVESDVIPFGRVKGERAFLAGLNLIGMERKGFDKSQIKQVQRAYKTLFSSDETFEERLNNVATTYNDNSEIQAIVEFARAKTKFPLCHPQKS